MVLKGCDDHKAQKISACICITILTAAAVIIVLDIYGLLPEKTFTAEHFGIETVKSGTDFDFDGTDDYSDILEGAKLDAKNRPRYVSEYYQNAYPPDNRGVCTDLVWRAFASAGYSLRDMVDKDIADCPEAYPNIEKRDDKIDFRRVPNLKIFFDRHAQTLTTDTADIEQWQPGDIVVINGTKHIGIVSDKRNKNGVPYLLHNGGQPDREEDILQSANITAHYRFDASKADPEILIGY